MTAAIMIPTFNDYSVCTTWLVKGETYYLLDIHRAKLHYPDLKRAVAMLAKQFGASAVIIEDKASGTDLIQDLAADPVMSVRPISVEPESDKVTRAAAQSMVIKAGRVFLPRSAAWLSDLRSEILQFPNRRHDEQVAARRCGVPCASKTQICEWIAHLAYD